MSNGSLRQNIAATVLRPIWRLLGASGGSRILMYHAIGSPVPGDVQDRYSLNPTRFAAQMQALVDLNRPIVPLTSAINSDIAITFDDGYRDNLTHALPILERFGLPFSIFVSTSFARSGDARYLTAADVKMLASHPLVSIGAHGESHSPLTVLDDASLSAELGGAKAWLEDVCGKSVTSMSYPHGAVDARVRTAVKVAGYTHACTSEFGSNPAHRDGLALRRIDIWSNDQELTFNAKLAGEWDWMRFFTRCGL